MTQPSVVQRQASGPHVACESMQEKSSNLKFVEKGVRLHLSHSNACAG